MRLLFAFGGLCSIAILLGPVSAAHAQPTRDEIRAALRRATVFYHTKVARHGGYLYQYSGDLKLAEAEGVPGPHTIWVQPPATPTVGEAFLAAYEATRDSVHLEAAKDAGRALALGQLQSGGWDYSVHFDPTARKNAVYRLDLDGKRLPERVPESVRRTAHGWDVWKRRAYKGNVTTLDDDTTQAAVRFLIRLDRALDRKDPQIHDAAVFALTSLLNVQYPSGGWSANFDRFQETPPPASDYPVKPASYPDDWPRKWPKNFTGCYVTNDDLMADMIDTLLVAWQVYDDAKYLQAAKRAGDFLLLAQLPEPQPAWAQQYDALMQPVWSRAFEPPAVSGRESQEIMKALIRLARATGDKKYLEPIPLALAYLRKSQLPDSKLARFYELRTNRPMYFTRDPDGRHVLTYDTRRLATNYAFIVDSHLDAIAADYRLAIQGKTPAAEPSITAREASKLIAALDKRGAWVVQGRLRHHRLEPVEGVIDSQRFADNVQALTGHLKSTR